MPTFNLQAAIDAAIQQTVAAALKADEALGQAAIDKLKADFAAQLKAALATDAAADAADNKLKDDLIDKLNARIEELQRDLRLCLAQTPPEYVPPVPPEPTPPGEPTPTGTWPDRNGSGTGVPADTVLKASGAIDVRASGTVLKNLDIKGQVWIAGNARDVVIENCRITSGEFYGVLCEGTCTMRNCEVIGFGVKPGSTGVAGSGTYVNVSITGFDNGFNPGNNSVIDHCWVHNLSEGPDDHPDGISLQGNQKNIVIKNSRIMAKGTSAVFIKTDFGPVDNVTVDNNYLGWDDRFYSYAVYVNQFKGAVTNIRVTNNTIEKGQYGWITTDKSSPVLTNNTQIAH